METEESDDLTYEEVAEESSLSPKKVLPLTMGFGEAMDAVATGKKITKLEWESRDTYGTLKDSFLCLRKDDGRFYRWTVSEGDMLGDDWIII